VVSKSLTQKVEIGNWGCKGQVGAFWRPTVPPININQMMLRRKGATSDPTGTRLSWSESFD
jgi:hypothetical protein